jgi:tetratricopeptide (TPR) repeat protein
MSDSGVAALLQEALAHLQSGRPAEALATLGRALQQDSANGDAKNLLGIIEMQRGRASEAARWFEQAAQVQPTGGILNNLAVAWMHLGRFDEARQALTMAVRAEPALFDAWDNLAVCARTRGNWDECAAALRHAVNIKPGDFKLFLRLGEAEGQSGRYEAALAAYRSAERLSPGNRDARLGVGTALTCLRKFPEAMEVLSSLAPESAAAKLALGRAMEGAGRLPEAAALYRELIHADPASHDAIYALARVCDHLGDTPGAIVHLRRALEIRPNDAGGWNTLSTLFRRVGDDAAALEAAEKAISIDSNLAEAHGNRALALLALGNYPEGFREYEWRWRCASFTTKPRELGRPMWDGSDCRGRVLLVHGEQGYGDTVQFVRFISDLKARGAKVILECAAPLVGLMRQLPVAERVVPAGMRLPDFDLHVPLLSLPSLLKVTEHTIPSQVPYLFVDPALAQRWKSRLAGSGLAVGLIWAGNTKPDPNRTCPPEELSRLSQLRGVRWFSLQKADPSNPASTRRPELELTDLAKELTDFHETAAAMEALDLVVTIDTAAAHVAGGLGRLGFVLLPAHADWRWRTTGETCPWYPTLRLLKQPRPNDWKDVIARLSEGLRALSARTSSTQDS